MVKKFNKKPSLKTIIILTITLFAVIAMLLSSALLFSRFNDTIVNSAMTSTAQASGHVAKSIDTFQSNMVEILTIIEDITGIATGEEFERDELLRLLDFRKDLSSIFIYNEKGEILNYVTSEEGELKENYQKSNLSFVLPEGKEFAVSSPHVSNIFEGSYPWVVSMSKRHNTSLHGNVIISIDIGFSGMAKYIDGTSIGIRGYAYIVNKDMKIVYHPQLQLIYSSLKNEDLAIISALMEKEESLSTNTNIYSVKKVKDVDWYIVGVSYIEELVTVRYDEVSLYMTLLTVFGAVVALALALIISRGFTSPINTLIHSMKQFEKGVATFESKEIKGMVEVETLSKSFQHMVRQIKELMERVKKEEKELRKVELKALQAQINPHFLYNTLDSILWMCEKNQSKKAGVMVSALAKLFRISISRGKDFIPVKDELKHVESYLIIQSIRYKNQFEYIFDIDPEILELKCFKITLQPFVENAIYHGLDRMVDEGRITISGRKVDERIEFKITDNGLGMSDEKLNEIFNENSDTTGIGVKNVHNRIQIYFGTSYGVTIKSELDEGTEVTITMPVIKEGDYE